METRSVNGQTCLYGYLLRCVDSQQQPIFNRSALRNARVEGDDAACRFKISLPLKVLHEMGCAARCTESAVGFFLRLNPLPYANITTHGKK